MKLIAQRTMPNSAWPSRQKRKRHFKNRRLHKIFVPQPVLALLISAKGNEAAGDKTKPSGIWDAVCEPQCSDSYGIIGPDMATSRVSMLWWPKQMARTTPSFFVEFSLARNFQHCCTEVDEEDTSDASAR